MEEGSEAMQQRIYRLLDELPAPSIKARVVRAFIMALILANVVAMVVESHYAEDSEMLERLYWFELFSVIVFSVEYLLRLWAIPASPEYGENLGSRIRFMLTPMMLIDLFAVLPFFLPFTRLSDARFLRILRLLRLGRVLKLGRYSKSMQLILRILGRKKADLLSVLFVLGLLLTVASTLMYYAEKDLQPAKFPNISQSLWWAVGTLTSVGFGEVEPMSMSGKFIGGSVAVLGVLAFALPAGIIASGYVEELTDAKAAKACPHCGEKLNA